MLGWAGLVDSAKIQGRPSRLPDFIIGALAASALLLTLLNAAAPH